MGDLFNLFIKSIFIENMIFAFFLGMCSYLAVSKKVSTAIGLGAAVIFVLAITVPMNWAIDKYILSEKGWFGLDLSFLRFIMFIATIAAMVQLVEMLVEKLSPSLYGTLGIFLPLIAVNCSILGGSLFMVTRSYTFSEALVFSLGSGIGWLLAIVFLAAIRERLRYSDVPNGLKGLGITMITTGLMGIAFMAFMGFKLESSETKSADEESAKIEQVEIKNADVSMTDVVK